MTPSALTERVVAVLRASALQGSTRPVSHGDTLGADGVGLDSLGLTEFIVALEGEFGLRFPDEFWTSRGRLTLGRIVAEIESCTAAHAGPAPEAADSARPAAGAEVEGVEPERGGLGARPGESVSPHGLIRPLGSVAARFAARGIGRVFRRQRQVLLAIDLRKHELLPPEDPRFAYRRATRDDLPALAGFWKPADQPAWDRRFEERLEQGLRCYVARHEGRIVAIDWVAENRADAPAIGLSIGIAAGSSYGLNLLEHRSFRGHGAGLALLVHVLRESGRAGLTRQATLVDGSNVRMLGASIQLLGFEAVGEVDTVWWFGRPSTRWRAEGRQGRGGTLPV